MDATAAEGSSSRAKSKPNPDGNVKDTIESILVAFILAFVFRAFVVEAFVIPTGSMAPTLLGAHMRYHCADCGYDYTVNYGRQGEISPPPKAGTITTAIRCPNCGYPVAASGPPENSLTNPPVHYGDRILVLKYRYLLSDPQHWDVIVFKSPDTPPPGSTLYTTNYIKRLIGKPGESVMLLDGDIYVSTAPPPGDPTQLADAYSRAMGRMPQDLSRAAQDRKDADAFVGFLRTFRIQRKPAHAQAALWRNVYDNDFLPHLPVDRRSESPWQQPWRSDSGTGWDVGQNLPEPQRGRTRVFHFDNASGAGQIAFDPQANPETNALTDFIAYDQYSESGNDENHRSVKNPVSDLKLSCFYKRESGDGPFRMVLTKRGQRFVAEVTPGQVSLARYDHRTGALIKNYGTVPLPRNAASGIRLDLANVDYRASLRVDDHEILASGDDYEPTGDAIVKLDNDESARQQPPLPEARVEAANQRCTVEHITLSRDVFYINDRNPPSNRPFRGSPGHIVTLKAEEFFALGDNSLISGDGRMWGNNVVLPGEDLPFVEAGRVPARFLLGKAFFVYWPAGHRPFGWDLGLIPNFGEMRFIR
jgi:signal peptidase I